MAKPNIVERSFSYALRIIKLYWELATEPFIKILSSMRLSAK